MAAITHAIHKEIAVYLNRRGKVVHVAVGNDYTVPLEEVFLKKRAEEIKRGAVYPHPSR
ncbi:MAG: hypothetical protein ACOX4H_02465 [Bacillota bacterium]